MAAEECAVGDFEKVVAAFQREVVALQTRCEQENKKLKRRNKRKHEEMLLELSQRRKEFDKELQEEKLELRKEREAFEKEKAAMNKLGPGSKDIVRINVGGTLFQVKRSTLCRAKGSMLESMFSGRWEKNIDRDENGNAFLDYDPGHLKIILDHLRHMGFANPEFSSKSLKIPGSKAAFWDLLKFLGLAQTFGRCIHTWVQTGAALECAGEGCKWAFCPPKPMFVTFFCSDCVAAGKAKWDVEKKRMKQCSHGCGYKLSNLEVAARGYSEPRQNARRFDASSDEDSDYEASDTDDGDSEAEDEAEPKPFVCGDFVCKECHEKGCPTKQIHVLA